MQGGSKGMIGYVGVSKGQGTWGCMWPSVGMRYIISGFMHQRSAEMHSACSAITSLECVHCDVFG